MQLLVVMYVYRAACIYHIIIYDVCDVCLCKGVCVHLYDCSFAWMCLMVQFSQALVL